MRSDLFRKAHQLTREDKKVYPEINYRVQFGLNLSALYVKINMSEEKVYKFDFNFTNDTRKGYPYVAKLEINEEGKIDRKFFELSKEWGKKTVTVYGQYEAQEGDIIEEREGGSWKNDYRYWYVILADGTKEFVANIDDSRQKINVTKYLKKEITLKQLLEGVN